MLPGLFSGGPGRRIACTGHLSAHQSAPSHRLRRLRHNPGHMAFPVRATAGNSWFRLVASGQFFPNLLGKLRQPGLVLGCPAGQPQIDGQWSVLRQRQPRRSHETQPTAQYPAIRQCILIGPIAIDADQNCACSIPFYNGKPLHRCTRAALPP